jgi:hypothetical protein
LFRPYTQYQTINGAITAGAAQYDAFQVGLTRYAKSVTVMLNYTFAKTLANNTTSGAFADYGVKEYWSVQPYDRAHVLNASYVYAFPKLSGGSAFDRGLLNGWEFSGISQIETGAQVTAVNGASMGLSGASSGINLSGSPDVTVFASLTCNPAKGLAKGQFVNGNCFSLPTSNVGNGRIPYMAGPKYWNSDATIRRNIQVSDHENLEFRFAAFNFLNHDLLSFNNGDSNLELNFNGTTGVLQNLTDPNDACPGPFCKAFGYANYHFGHRILEMGVRFSF